MSDRSYEVDKYGTYYSRENRSHSPSSYSDHSDGSYRSRSESRSYNYKHRQRSYSRSRSRSYSRPRSSRRDWIVPTNPLLRGDDDSYHRHHRHHHHHHHHHHHRHRSHSPKRLTVADKKERWGHELYIENVCEFLALLLFVGSPQSRARASPCGGRLAASPGKVDLEGRRRCDFYKQTNKCLVLPRSTLFECTLQLPCFFQKQTNTQQKGKPYNSPLLNSEIRKIA